MESSRNSQLAKSLSNLYQIVEIYNSTCRLRARSLPNIVIPPRKGGESQYFLHQYPTDFNGGGPVNKKHHHHHNKILKKTWDKVKTAIIHTTSSHSYRRSSLNKTKLDSSSATSCSSSSKQGMNNLPQCSSATTAVGTSSAPSTPLHKHTFDFDNQQNQTQNLLGITRSQHDFLRSVSANAGDMRSHGQDTSAGGENLGESRRPTRSEDEEKEEEKLSIAATHQKNLQEESQKIQQNYAKLQKRLSEELHQRMSEHKPPDSKTIENLSEDFKKRLRQWEMWRVSTGKVTYTDEEIAQILPLEFSQKLLEWQTIKTSGIHSQQGHSKTPDSIGSGTTTSHARDTSSPEVLPTTKNKLLRKKKSSSESSRQKELAWLEKQLEKIEVEKKRLEREMKKYVEREARLEKMKEALQNASPSGVNSTTLTRNDGAPTWIRTPTGKCKVEKLTEKFTKKLYQWEEMHGIQPESSTMALLHPKYYGPPPTANDDVDAEIESRAQAEFNCRRYKDDSSDDIRPTISSERESESRQDECELAAEVDDRGCVSGEEEGTEHEDNEELYDQEEDKIDADHHNQQPRHDEQEHRLSSASSSDFEEATDSFATHDKGNSGASNTDSDFNYRAEFPSCRRRSSEAISTPLSARSPSLSAFTSDDEAETCGLLKTVSEENENTNTLRDAESQTEIILRAQPIVVEDDDENDERSLYGGDESQAGIFVQTKRTIFTPIEFFDEESEPEKVVLIEGQEQQEHEHLLLKSPSLIRKAIQETAQSPVTKPIIIASSPPDIHLPCFSSSSNSFSIAAKKQSPRISPIPPPTPTSPGLMMKITTPTTHQKPPPPRIVEVTPKIHPIPSTTISQIRSFPKMGKVPCSPLGIRRNLGNIGDSSCGSGGLISQHSSSSVDFSSTTDPFLAESNYFRHPHQHESVPCSSTSLVSTASISSATITNHPQPSSSSQLSKIPFRGGGGRRNTSASTTTTPTVPLVEESGIVGASIQTGQRHPAFPVRSSSFRIQRNIMSSDNHHQQQQAPISTTNKGFYAQLRSRVGSVAKSQSTGSIRSKLGKAFSTFTHKMSPKEQQNPTCSSNEQVGSRNQQQQQQQGGSSGEGATTSINHPDK